MGGIFGKKPAPPPAAPKEKVKGAQDRAEERAEAEEKTQQQGVQRRRRLQRSGGMRLLFSPFRQEGPGAIGSVKTKLGGGS